MAVFFLKRPHMPSHPLSFFLLDLLSFERPDALPTICALAVKVSSAIAIAASNPLHLETARYLEKSLPNLINGTSALQIHDARLKLLAPLALVMSMACLRFPNCPYLFEKVRKPHNEAY